MNEHKERHTDRSVRLGGLLCCPHCGGFSGYSYARLERWSVFGDWSFDEFAEHDCVEKETKPRCRDCGKIIKQAT